MAVVPSPVARRTDVLVRLDDLRRRVAIAVERRRQVDPEPDDPFRGSYISDEQAGRLLARRPDLVPASGESTSPTGPADDVTSPMAWLGPLVGIDGLDVELLMVVLGPDLDPRLEHAYGYLHDDLTRRRASVGLALELCGADSADAEARSRLSPAGSLVGRGLLRIEDDDRPMLTRALRAPDAVVDFLLGGGGTDPLVTGAQVPTVVDRRLATERIQRALAAGTTSIHLRDQVGTAALSAAATAVSALGSKVLALDTRLVDPLQPLDAVVRGANLQAALADRVLVIVGVEQLAERAPSTLRSLVADPVRVVFIGDRGWDPTWSPDPVLVLDAPPIPAGGDDIGDLALRLTPEQALRARRTAEMLAAAEGTECTSEQLVRGVRAQNAGGLERLALRITPGATWPDLVLPREVSRQLEELADRVRTRHLVRREWRLGRGARGDGVTALFAGPSGTGKTLAAEVVAAELGLDLYVIDLATVVDKYIGETEKNLDRIFAEADRVNGVLVFDEADALFGKRSDVSDARDRYANVEVAYLLQRMERFDGVAVMTTNLRANIDEAFLRRLDLLVDFPTPDASMRRRLWECHLPDSLPRSEDVDLDYLAGSFELAGGNIANVALTSAHLAAANGGRVTMEHLVSATAAEYRKLGRLCVAAEFGDWFRVVQRG